MLVVTKYYFGA